jgi:hypothetical protein
MPVTLRRHDIVAAVVIAGAFALRVWAVDFGLPHAEARPDELTIAYQAMKFGTGDLDPHSFNYPSLHKYVTFVLFGAWYALGRLTGHYGGQEDFLRDFFDGAVDFRLLMRLWSVLLGTVGVALLVRAPGRLWGAALLAVAFLHVRDSHFGVTDITMVTLATAAVLAAEAHRATPSTRRLVLAAVLAGLATSTKYNAGLLCVPLALAAGSARAVALAAVVMVAAFLVGTPYAALDFPMFSTDFRYEATHLSEGQFVDVGNGWVHHAVTLWRTCGPSFVLLALSGLFFAPREGWRRAGVLYGFPLVYFLVIGRGHTAFFRYILPVVPILAIAAGDLIARVRNRIAAVLLLVAAAFPTALASVQSDRLMAAGDTRDAMATWIEANVPTEATLVHAGTYSGAPMLQRNVANLTREYVAKQGRADAAGFRKPDDAKWYTRSRPMYDVLFVAKPGIDFASQLPVDTVLASPPEWLLLEDYFLVHYSSVPDAVRALAASPRYTLVHTEAATDGPVSDPWFDQQDAFYLPAAGFRGFVRMGPTLRLYHRNPS